MVLDLRLLSAGMLRQPVPRLAQHVRPYLLAGLILMIVTGIPLFLSEAEKCYDNPAFWFKISFLAAAILFQYTVHRAVESGRASAFAQKFAAVTSMVLWLGVGVGGRAIGFV